MPYSAEKILEMLPNPIKISVDESDLDFQTAKDIAKEKARETSNDPMLLAWYNGQTGDFYPKTQCGRLDKPAWIVYAESRGGDLTIDINDETFVFIYLSYNRPMRSGNRR